LNEDKIDFTIQELDTMKEIIDVAAKRGAFGGGELKNVGIMYEIVLTVMHNIQERQQQEIASLQQPEEYSGE
jgi:hypothetical protein